MSGFEIEFYTNSIKEICLRYAVKRLVIFGSSLREDFDNMKSDIDLFYEFKGTENLFLRYMNFKRELEHLFGRRVDLLKEEQIQNPFIQRQVKNSPRKQLYET